MRSWVWGVALCVVAIVPAAAFAQPRIGLLWLKSETTAQNLAYPTSAGQSESFKRAEAAAETLGLRVHLAEVRTPQDIELALQGASRAGVDERATRLYLSINVKTAKAIRITVPPAMVLRADRVIE